MHRYFFVIVALVLVDPATAVSQQGQPPAQPGIREHQEPDRRVPAAQYSPLAAKGGYSDGSTSPLEAMVHALNPRDVNLGAMWEERRRAWLENAGANRYFWYSFGATILVILSWFALAWVQNDRVRERWQLAEHAADALRYAEYCKRKAKEAIDRYNLHIETCNRVIEAGESGIATPETANLEDYKREIQRLKSDNDAKELQVARLTEQLEQKAAELNSLTERVTAAEQRLRKGRSAPGSESANAELVERIQRLEAENRRLKQGKTAAAKAATAETELRLRKVMLVAVQSFGSIWTARGASRGTGLREVRAARRLLQHDWRPGWEQTAEPVVCLRLRPVGRVFRVSCGARRTDHPSCLRVGGVSVWNGRNKLFLRRLMPAGSRPDAYLFRMGSAERDGSTEAAPGNAMPRAMVSFSEGNGQQECLIVLPPFGWVYGEHGTFCVDPQQDRPWIAALSRAAR